MIQLNVFSFFNYPQPRCTAGRVKINTTDYKRKSTRQIRSTLKDLLMIQLVELVAHVQKCQWCAKSTDRGIKILNQRLVCKNKQAPRESRCRTKRPLGLVLCLWRISSEPFTFALSPRSPDVSCISFLMINTLCKRQTLQMFSWWVSLEGMWQKVHWTYVKKHKQLLNRIALYLMIFLSPSCWQLCHEVLSYLQYFLVITSVGYCLFFSDTGVLMVPEPKTYFFIG